MGKISKRNLAIIMIALSICVSSLIIATSFAVKARQESPGECVLTSYGNTVALFVDGDLAEVYSDIVLDTLPKQDIDQLKNGIAFSTPEEAREAIEDYDG